MNAISGALRSFRATPALGALTVLGIALSLILTKTLSSQLYAVSPRDPAVLSGVTAFVVLLAAVAAYLPARRAARVDPIESLRRD